MNAGLECARDKLLGYLETGKARTLIALAGLPGGGKSTFAARLSEAMNQSCEPGTLAVLGMDGFHLTRSALAQMPDPAAALARRGAPWTFDAPALAGRLEMLRDYGKAAVAWPDFQHDIGDPVEDAHFVPSSTRLVLVEGLYLLMKSPPWDRVASCFDERWYLDTPFEVAMSRLTDRHMKAWNISRQEAERRIAVNDRLNAEIVLGSRSNGDWIIS